ncbi:MAG: MFS transporter [Actinomycetota bacterium]|nr:MFS transporter [Actinomycetota bacterium]
MRSGLAGLLLAQAVSVTGTRMSMVALPWFVLETTASPTRMGLVAFAEMLPYVLGALLAAPLVDRVGARRAGVTCDVGSAVAVAAVPLLHQAQALSFPALLALVAVAGGLRGPGDNAKYVLLPDVTAGARVPLERTTALYDGVNRAAAGRRTARRRAHRGLQRDDRALRRCGVVRPRRGSGGDPGLPARARPRRGHGRSRAGVRRSAGGGTALPVRDRLLVAIAAMLFVTNFLDRAYVAVLLPVWSRETGHGAVGIGVASGVFAAGATVGSLAMAALAARLPRRTTFLVAFLIAGAPRYVAMAMEAPLPAVLAVVAASGLAAGVLNPILTAVDLERVPEGLRARVLSASTAVAFGGIPLGGLCAGWLVGRAGIGTALALGAGAYLLATLAPFGRTWRGMDQTRATPVPAPQDGAHESAAHEDGAHEDRASQALPRTAPTSALPRRRQTSGPDGVAPTWEESVARRRPR